MTSFMDCPMCGAPMALVPRLIGGEWVDCPAGHHASTAPNLWNDEHLDKVIAAVNAYVASLRENPPPTGRGGAPAARAC